MWWEYPEIQKAITRIKSRQKAQTDYEFYRVLLSWYLDLCDLDLTILSEGTWLDLRYELFVLLFVVEAQREFWLEDEEGSRERLPSDLLDKETIEKIQSHLRRSEERRVGKECRSRWSPY